MMTRLWLRVMGTVTDLGSASGWAAGLGEFCARAEMVRMRTTTVLDRM
jgi:hypothetical protein